MKKQKLKGLFGSIVICMMLFACAANQNIKSDPRLPEVKFFSSGRALVSIPSLNGNHISIRIVKPEGDGPFPTLIAIAGGDGTFAFRTKLSDMLREKRIVTVDFAPQGRGDSEGEDNHHGTIHQDDLKALVDFLNKQPFVEKDKIGILSYSFGIAMAAGALARYPEMPIAFLIDWEGPSCPGTDFKRGLENNESWPQDAMSFLSGNRNMNPKDFKLHGGSIFDEKYWQERDAALFAEDLPCPYLRVQFDHDHVQSIYKGHMIRIINAATAKSGQWTRCNDNPPNTIYSKDDLSKYHFHQYSNDESGGFTSWSSQSVNTVLFDYIEEMFFEQPYKK